MPYNCVKFFCVNEFLNFDHIWSKISWKCLIKLFNKWSLPKSSIFLISPLVGIISWWKPYAELDINLYSLPKMNSIEQFFNFVIS